MEDVGKATDLIHEIGSMIVSDERYAGTAWESIALIITLDGSVQSKSGFFWQDGGKASPGYPRNPAMLDKFEELQAATRNPGGREWKSALVQIKRDTMKITIDYEYDDVSRWKVTPMNIDQMREDLRPR
jgi:hypothetical protein